LPTSSLPPLPEKDPLKAFFDPLAASGAFLLYDLICTDVGEDQRDASTAALEAVERAACREKARRQALERREAERERAAREGSILLNCLPMVDSFL
jgi:hypothetical protein